MSNRKRPEKSQTQRSQLTEAPRPFKGVVPAHFACLFDEPPLIEGEDPSRYLVVFRGYKDAVHPEHMIDWLAVKTLTDLTWEIDRYKRARRDLIAAQRPEELKQLIMQLLADQSFGVSFDHEDKARALMVGWRREDPEAKKEVEALLSDHRLDVGILTSRSLVTLLDKLEKIDRLQVRQEQRLEAQLSEVRRRRADRATEVEALEGEILK